MSRQNAFLGIDVGSISTKAVIIDDNNAILAQEYIWTEGNPIGAVKKLLIDKRIISAVIDGIECYAPSDMDGIR